MAKKKKHQRNQQTNKYSITAFSGQLVNGVTENRTLNCGVMP